MDPSAGSPVAGEKGEKPGKEEVVKTGVAAGGIDQYVLAGCVVALLRLGVQVPDNGYCAVL